MRGVYFGSAWNQSKPEKLEATLHRAHVPGPRGFLWWWAKGLTPRFNMPWPMEEGLADTDSYRPVPLSRLRRKTTFSFTAGVVGAVASPMVGGDAPAVESLGVFDEENEDFDDEPWAGVGLDEPC